MFYITTVLLQLGDKNPLVPNPSGSYILQMSSPTYKYWNLHEFGYEMQHYKSTRSAGTGKETESEQENVLHYDVILLHLHYGGGQKYRLHATIYNVLKTLIW